MAASRPPPSPAPRGCTFGQILHYGSLRPAREAGDELPKRQKVLVLATPKRAAVTVTGPL